MPRKRSRAPSGCCVKCGLWRSSLHKDHVQPTWQGGVDDPTNYQYLCANCHEDKTFAERKTPEFSAFQSKVISARMLSPEARANISKGVRESNKYREWLAHSRHKCGWNRGKKLPPFSAEHRANMSKARMGIKLSDETRKAISLGHLGKPWSAARRQRHEEKYGRAA